MFYPSDSNSANHTGILGTCIGNKCLRDIQCMCSLCNKGETALKNHLKSPLKFLLEFLFPLSCNLANVPICFCYAFNFQILQIFPLCITDNMPACDFGLILTVHLRSGSLGPEANQCNTIICCLKPVTKSFSLLVKSISSWIKQS